MVNQIDAKRKELENDVEVFGKNSECQDYLNGFNLGVSMARKEFLEKVNKWIFKHVSFKENIMTLNDEKATLITENDIKELRQQIGGKDDN